MAALVNNLRVDGICYYIPHFDPNEKYRAILQISFGETSTCIRQLSKTQYSITEIHHHRPQPTTTINLPYPALQHPDQCRSYISDVTLELSPADLDRLADKVVSTAANLAAKSLTTAERSGKGLAFDIKAVFHQVVKVVAEGDIGKDEVLQLTTIGDGLYIPLTESARVSAGTCSICLDDYSKASGGIEEIGLFGCNHVFHSSCIISG